VAFPQRRAALTTPRERAHSLGAPCCHVVARASGRCWRQARAGIWLLCALVCTNARVLSAGAQPNFQCGARPWVAVTFDGQAWPPALRADLTADLRAGLRLRGIDACPAEQETTAPPIAQLVLRMSGGERVLVSIDVRDAITDKRVLRDVDLHAAASDARGLLLAQAADELLRASWVELTIEDAPKPVMPPPAAITRVVQRSRPAPLRLNAIELRFASEYHTGGQTLLGAEAALQLWLSDTLTGSVAVGLRTGLVVDANHGNVGSSALTVAFALALPVLPRESRYNLFVGLGLFAGELSVAGRARDPAARASRHSALFATGRAGVTGSWRLADRLQATLELGPGLPLRSVSAYDTGHEVVSTSGLELHGSLGVGGLF
jgi:hypothetical protein